MEVNASPETLPRALAAPQPSDADCDFYDKPSEPTVAFETTEYFDYSAGSATLIDTLSRDEPDSPRRAGAVQGGGFCFEPTITDDISPHRAVPLATDRAHSLVKLRPLLASSQYSLFSGPKGTASSARFLKRPADSPSPSPEFEGESMSHIAQQDQAGQMPMTLESWQPSAGYHPMELHHPVVDELSSQSQEQRLRRERLKQALLLRRAQAAALAQVQSDCPQQLATGLAEPQAYPFESSFETSNQPLLKLHHRSSLDRHHSYLSPDLLGRLTDRHLDTDLLSIRKGGKACYLPFIVGGQRADVWGHYLFAMQLDEKFGNDLVETDHPNFLACMMFVSGYDPEAYNLRYLYSVFSVYGNVSYILHYREAGALFIMMTSPLAVTLCRKHLHKVVVLGCMLHIEPLSTSDALDPCFLYCQPEIFVPRSSYRRFKQDIPKEVYGLSRSLQICVLYSRKRIALSDQDFKDMLAPTECVPTQTRKDPTKGHINMWFVDYQEQDQAVRTLMMLQATEFEGGRVRISFTKSKKSARTRAIATVGFDNRDDEKLFVVQHPGELPPIELSCDEDVEYEHIGYDDPEEFPPIA